MGCGSECDCMVLVDLAKPWSSQSVASINAVLWVCGSLIVVTISNEYGDAKRVHDLQLVHACLLCIVRLMATYFGSSIVVNPQARWRLNSWLKYLLRTSLH